MKIQVAAASVQSLCTYYNSASSLQKLLLEIKRGYEMKKEEEKMGSKGKGSKEKGILENKASIKAFHIVQIVRQCHTNVPF